MKNFIRANSHYNRYASPLCGAALALALLLPLCITTPVSAAPPVKKATKKTKTKKAVVKPIAKKAAVKKAVPVKIAPKITKLIPKPTPRPILKPTPKPTPISVVNRPPLSPAPRFTAVKMFTPVSLAGAQVTLIEAETTNIELPTLFGSNPPDAGTEYIVFTISVKNLTDAPLSWTIDTLNPRLQMLNPNQKPVRGTSLLTENDKKLDKPIEANGEKVLRIPFQIPKDALPDTLTMGASNGMEYRFDVRKAQ